MTNERHGRARPRGVRAILTACSVAGAPGGDHTSAPSIADAWAWDTRSVTGFSDRFGQRPYWRGHGLKPKLASDTGAAARRDGSAASRQHLCARAMVLAIYRRDFGPAALRQSLTQGGNIGAAALAPGHPHPEHGGQRHEPHWLPLRPPRFPRTGGDRATSATEATADRARYGLGGAGLWAGVVGSTRIAPSQQRPATLVQAPGAGARRRRATREPQIDWWMTVRAPLRGRAYNQLLSPICPSPLYMTMSRNMAQLCRDSTIVATKNGVELRDRRALEGFGAGGARGRTSGGGLNG
jgi:hypothetical protein